MCVCVLCRVVFACALSRVVVVYLFSRNCNIKQSCIHVCFLLLFIVFVVKSVDVYVYIYRITVLSVFFQDNLKTTKYH